MACPPSDKFHRRGPVVAVVLLAFFALAVSIDAAPRYLFPWEIC